MDISKFCFPFHCCLVRSLCSGNPNSATTLVGVADEPSHGKGLRLLFMLLHAREGNCASIGTCNTQLALGVRQCICT